MSLYNNQKNISFDIFNALDKKELFNIPTGTGKTLILLDVAKKCLLENKKVVISTPNNHLVREMYKAALEFKFFKDNEISIKIGADNYIDRTKFQFYINTEIIFSYIENTKEELEDFINNAEDLFFDDFDEFAKYKDIALKSTLRILITKSYNEEEKGFGTNIIITNHFYLISKIIYAKSFDISQYVLLVDEVHQIAEVSENILNEKFSFFEFKNVLLSIKKQMKDIEFKGKDTFLKNIQTLFVRAFNNQKKFTKENEVGNFIQGYKEQKECFDSVEAIISSREYVNSISKITKMSDKPEFIIYENYFKKVKKYADKFKNLDKSEKSCGVYYSPSKGYPNLFISHSNPLGILNKLFWNKIELFAGVSATITSSFSPDIYEIKYGYSRLGMSEKNRDYKIHFYNRVFPKELVNIHLPKKDDIAIENVYSDSFIPFESDYYEKKIKEVHDTFNGLNSIVLCGGYAEAKYMYDLYMKRFNVDCNLDYAKSKEKTFSTIERFKRNGGILFATRNYNTGISLKGKLLENLYILKFPFVDYTSKKWQEIKNSSMGKFVVNNEREMLITFMQTLGRLQRTKEDKGNIYILDDRYHSFSEKRKKAIKDIIFEYGKLIEHKEIEKSDEKEIDINECEAELEKLLLLR